MLNLATSYIDFILPIHNNTPKPNVLNMEPNPQVLEALLNVQSHPNDYLSDYPGNLMKRAYNFLILNGIMRKTILTAAAENKLDVLFKEAKLNQEAGYALPDIGKKEGLKYNSEE